MHTVARPPTRQSSPQPSREQDIYEKLAEATVEKNRRLGALLPAMSEPEATVSETLHTLLVLLSSSLRCSL